MGFLRLVQPAPKAEGVIPRPGIPRDEAAGARVHVARPQMLQAGGVGPFSGEAVVACARAKAADHLAVRGIVLAEDDRAGGIGQLAHRAKGIAELVGPGRVELADPSSAIQVSSGTV